MTEVIDFFGIDVTHSSDVDWQQITEEQICPYIDKKCLKVRKSQPATSIGTCTIRHGRDSHPIMICPYRFLERQQVFIDCFHLLRDHSPGFELHVVPEVVIPGGKIDYFLVSTHEGKVRDFVGIEIQALDTTGTVWPERQRLLQRLGMTVEDDGALSKKTVGINWKMSAKTSLMQLLHKIQTFENLNRHLVLVIQDRFLDYFTREFRFEHMREAQLADAMQFHSYTISGRTASNRIALAKRLSTNAEGVANSLRLRADSPTRLEELLTTIEAKVSDTTRLTLPSDEMVTNDINPVR